MQFDGYINVLAESCNTYTTGTISEQIQFYTEKLLIICFSYTHKNNSPLLNLSAHYTKTGNISQAKGIHF